MNRSGHLKLLRYPKSNTPKEKINLTIPSSPQHPKFVVIDDPEIVGDLIAEGFPFVG